MKRIALTAILISCYQTGYAHHPASIGSAVAGAILTPSRNTLEQSSWNLSVNLTQIDFNSFSDTQLEVFGNNDQEVDSLASIQSVFFNLAWGITDATQLSISLPYIALNDIKISHNNLGVGEVHYHGDITGTGDMMLLMQHNFEQFALQAGIKFKTGDTHLTDATGNVLEADHQPGSAANDYMLGLIYSYPTDTSVYDFNVLYTRTGTSNDGLHRGDTLRWNTAVSFATETKWRYALELNGESQMQQQDAGVKNENSGGHSVFLSPGTRFNFDENKTFYISIGIPMWQSLHGIQHETSWRLISGISMSY